MSQGHPVVSGRAGIGAQLGDSRVRALSHLGRQWRPGPALPAELSVMRGCSVPVPAKPVATGHMWLLSSYKVADGTMGGKAAHPTSAFGL